MIYRRPIAYIPPYNYCDRGCEACAIDKSRCLLYQTEMDERLHREIDGGGEPTPQEVVGRIVSDARKALRMVEEQVREMGFDPEALKAAAPDREVRPPARKDPAVAEAAALVRSASAFLRAHGAGHPAEAAAARRALTLVAPKVGRAALEAADAIAAADSILQAQVAHQALGVVEGALEAMRRRKPALGDAMVDPRARLARLRRTLEDRWLSRPCDLLEPAADGVWWGPLRDITPTLKRFRR